MLRNTRHLNELPPLPEADHEGNRPALEYIRATIARDTGEPAIAGGEPVRTRTLRAVGGVRERKALGLTQQQLSKLSGVRAETVTRIIGGIRGS